MFAFIPLTRCLIFLLACLCCAQSIAQPAPRRIRGEVVAVDGLDLRVRTRAGETVAVRLDQQYSVTAVVPADIGSIKPGSYVGTATIVTIPADAPIVTFEPGERALLQQGAHVMFSATPLPDGTLTATRISAGKNGLVPPM